jgi:sRNA-binding protein
MIAKIDPHPVIIMLCEKFPACFAMFEQRRKPLALGIHKEIALAMPALTKEQISAAMRAYVGNEFYCRACRAGAPRINLLGHEAGVVTAAEADSAVARLAGIREWKKKKKDKAAKAKVEALAAAKAAEIEAKKPKPKGVNATRPTLHLKGMTS